MPRYIPKYAMRKHSKQFGARFLKTDSQLPWDKIIKQKRQELSQKPEPLNEKPNTCINCDAARGTICLVRAFSLPKGLNCNVTEKEWTAWKERG